jgi:hypothetical protein
MEGSETLSYENAEGFVIAETAQNANLSAEMAGGKKPLNIHFVQAAGSASVAEIAQVQQIAPVMPPLMCSLAGSR